MPAEFAAEFSPHTLRAYQRMWAWLQTMGVMEGVRVEALGQDVAEGWWSDWSAGKKAATLAQSLAALAHWYGSRGLENPFGAVSRPTAPSSTTKALTSAELGRLLRELDRAGEKSFGGAQTACVATLLVVTGWRFQDLVALRLDDLEWADGEARGWRGMRDAGGGVETGQGAEGRGARGAVRLPAAVAGMLARFLTLRSAVVAQKARRGRHGLARLKAERVFLNLRGGPLPAETFNRHLRTACQSAGLPAVSAHGLRQCAARMAMHEEGQSLQTVQQLLGHGALRTTRRALKSPGIEE